MSPGRGTVVLTFDNLGEAAEIERGLWPPDRPTGRHPSVTEVLPRLLDRLDELGLRATFCIEAINTEHYPDAVLEIARRGHEVAHHAWRHEAWAELDAEREADILGRGREAFAALGIAVRGFRPPGGGLTDRSLRLIHDAGLAWCSPAGEHPFRDSTGVAVVPFRWPLVDATYLHPPFEDLRSDLDLPAEPLSAADAGQRLRAELEAGADEAATLVLHPFLAAEPAVREVVEDLLARLAAGRDAGTLRVITAGQLAEEL